MLSLMTQYTPIPNRRRQMPGRYLSAEEYNTVIKWLDEFKIEDGFCQELVTGSDWLPDFKRHNPFPSELSVPVVLPAKLKPDVNAKTVACPTLNGCLRSKISANIKLKSS